MIEFTEMEKEEEYAESHAIEISGMELSDFEEYAKDYFPHCHKMLLKKGKPIAKYDCITEELIEL